MFAKNYYCLVAGLREYALDADVKGFDARAIREEILEELTAADAREVRLLYGYYDCENLIARFGGRSAYNPLGSLTSDEIGEALQNPDLLPAEMAGVVRAYRNPESEEAEELDMSRSFESNLLEAYYRTCARAKSRFLREWSTFDRTLRNIAAAVAARAAGRDVERVTVGEDDVTEQLRRSSASDFGLRGELSYVDAVIAAVNDEPNLLEKEHKIDLIRWNESLELTVQNYFDIDAVLAYLVRVNIVARWTLLDRERGRELFEELLRSLDAKEKINKQ